MARVPGVSQGSSFQNYNKKPFDSKMQVNTIEDLLNKNNWAGQLEGSICAFNGMIVSVGNSATNTNSFEGVYVLKDWTKLESLDAWIRLDEKSTSGIAMEVLEALPESGEANTLYFIAEGNGYVEYMWVNDKWEIIGGTTVDLSNYYTKSEVDTKIEEVVSASVTSLASKVGEVDSKADEISTNVSEVSTKVNEVETKVNEILNSGWQEI